MSMKSNRPNASALPSPSFPYSTSLTVPKSSPLLSSSFTPFYPRSQQQQYNNAQLAPPGNHDGGFHASLQKSDDNDADKGHPYAWSCERGPKFYDQQYYASSGSEPYEVPWISNNANVWGNGAWQWGDTGAVEYAYVDDDGEDSAYLLSDSLSYYAESPALEHEFYACSTGNIESLSAPFSDRGATASFSVFHGSAMPEQASILSKTKEHLTPRFRKLSTKEQTVSVCASEKQGLATGTRNEVANASVSSKLDTRPFSIQVSSQIGSSVGIATQAIEPKLKQGATDVAENKRARTESSELTKNSFKLSTEQGSRDATVSKHSIYATSIPSNTLELLKGNNQDSPTIPLPAKVIQNKVSSINSSSFQSDLTHLQPTSGHCPIMKVPKPVNARACSSSLVPTVSLDQMIKGSLLNEASLGMEMEGKRRAEAIDLEAMHQDSMSSSYCLPGDAVLCSNGPQLLVQTIHNLSKVLLSSQSGTSLNILDSIDCLAIENTICMLSRRLFQSSVNEADFITAEQELKNSDDSTKSVKEAGSETFLQKSSRLLAGMKPKIETVYPKRVLENESWDNSSKVTERSCVGGDEKSDQSSSVKKQLEEPWEQIVMLQGEVRKLQEEVGYERAESNATVMIYQKLWSEAQGALKESRSEVREMKAELACLNQEFRNMKLLEGSGGLRSMPKNLDLTKYDMNTCINQGGVNENFSDVATSSSTVRDLGRAPNGNENVAFCGSPNEHLLPKEHLPESDEVLTGYFDPGNIPNCRENWTPLSKGEKAILRHNDKEASSNQDGSKFDVSASEPSSKHTFGPPANLEDEVTRRLSLLLARQGKTRSDRNVESPSDLSTLEPSSNLPREGEAMPPDKNLNCLSWSETSSMKNGQHGPVEREPNGRGVNVEEVKVSTSQEDEIEIICFKPGVADSSFTCLKGEPEWEHVVVNVLDDHHGILSRKVN
eukprot:c16384_g1_i1 orf=376-3213(+)